jgi:hypothetical protein
VRDKKNSSALSVFNGGSFIENIENIGISLQKM